MTHIARTVGIATMIGCSEFAQGGWTGGMNGTGYGWAGVNVTSSTLATGSARTATLPGPSAAMNPFQDYRAQAFLPSGSSTATYARVKGLPGYIWQASTSGSNGDRTDNQEINQRIAIKPAACTLLTMESELVSFDPQSGSGSFKVKTMGTAGTALLLRGYEVDDWNNIPSDDPDTTVDESLAYVKSHGDLKFENLIIGPFEYGFNGKCELIVHFTLEGGTLDNFIFTSDGAAESLPIAVTCPPLQVVECGSTYVYPDVSVNSCRDFELDYVPSEDQLHPGLNTVTVTATATDGSGDSGSCTFVVNVVDTTAPAIPTLPDITASCGTPVTPTPPTTTDRCEGLITGTTTTPFPITQPGTTVVTWTFTDSQGNSVTANQKVIIGGYSFVGFYSPIGAVGGSCSQIAKDINRGSTVPIKFDFKCGSSFITSGPKPVVKIQRFSNSCQLLSQPVSIEAEYQNDWHINWDTGGWDKGIYKIIAVLPDGTSHFVFVKLK
jgi:hypothetical protein